MESKHSIDLRPLVAEVFATFTLVLAGTGAIVFNDVSQGAITHVGIALTFGLVVTAMIYAVGDVSGCHINPAVTIALAIAGRFESRKIIPYLISQLLGALLASCLLKAMYPEHETLGATLPKGGILVSFVLETLLTLILMFVVLAVTSRSKEVVALAGIVIGAVIALEALFAGPICGASMNPARSLGPALMAVRLEEIWIYLFAPTLGACLAVPLYNYLYPARTEATA